MRQTDTLLYKRKGELQRKIIKMIATQDKKSKISLERSLNEHHHSTIDRAVKTLVGNGYLKGPFSAIPRHRGRPEKFFEITDKAINFFINDLDISLEDFWRMIFYIFDTSNHFKTTFTIDELFRTYEVKRLGLKREHTISHVYQKIPDIDFISTINFLPEHYEILEILALKGILTENKIKKLLNKNQEYRIPKVLFDADFLIMKIKDKGLPKYRLTLLGLQFFVFKFLSEYRSESIEKTDIIKNHYGFLLPKIFSKWKWLERYFTQRNLLDALVNAINLNSHEQPFQTNKGIQEILDSQRNLSKVYDEKIETEFSIGLRIMSGFIDEKTRSYIKYKKFDRKTDPDEEIDTISILLEDEWENIHSKIMNLIPEIDKMIDKLRALLGFPDGEWNKFVKDLNEQILGYEEIMADSISFRFYCILTSWIQEDEDESMDDWIKYLKRDKDLMPWFSEWLQEINEFERENQPIRENFVKSFL